MPLIKFVRNVQDLSDDGGYKFRFCCDNCGDGFESQYISSSANMLKTGLDIFQMFKPLGGFGNVAGNIDRGLRGKERDAAYEKAANEAMAFFKKCSKCNNWVCPEECWNAEAGLCESCAPQAEDAGASQAAKLRAQQAVNKANQGESTQTLTCPACQKRTKPGKFCVSCGASLSVKSCAKCLTALAPGENFCSNCGTKAR